MTIRRQSVLIAALAIMALTLIMTLGACGQKDGTTDAKSDANTGDSEYGQAQIFAAASMKTVGDELASAFTKSHPGADLKFNYAGSSDLVRQIEQGAPADMFISANQKNMVKALAGKDFADATPHVIVTNELVLALAPGNPGHISGLKDLEGKHVAICAPEVPCGTIAHKVLENANLTLDKPSEESNVAEVSTKVSTGAVDAGFIYSTDARALADQQVTAVKISGVAPNEYPVALTTRGQENATAKAFDQWLREDEAQKIFTDHGFTSAT